MRDEGLKLNPKSMSILAVKNVSFSYGAEEALRDVSFDVQKGDYVGLAGPNGAGKTTLIKVLLGLIDGYTGSAELFGLGLRNFSAWNRVGYLPQRVNAFNPLFPATVKEVVGLGLLSKKSFPKRFTAADEVRILQTLDLMGAADLGDKLVGELSGGQQQRVFLARALRRTPNSSSWTSPARPWTRSHGKAFMTS